MKGKALIALALMVVVTLLAGCGGGVSQEEFDAAVADKEAAQAQVTSLQSQLTKANSDLTAANTAKTTAETALATAQAELTKAKADLATCTSSLNASKTEVTSLKAKVTELEAKVASLEKDLAACKAGSGGGGTTPPPSGGFTGTKYTNTEYGFSFQYPTSWTAATTLPTHAIAKFGAAPYNLPTVFVGAEDQAGNATLEDAFKKYVTANNYAWKTYTATSITIGSVTCTKADVTYVSSAYGDIIGTIVGFTKNNKWVFIGAVTISSLGDWSTATEKNDIINSITFP